MQRKTVIQPSFLLQLGLKFVQVNSLLLIDSWILKTTMVASILAITLTQHIWGLEKMLRVEREGCGVRRNEPICLLVADCGTHLVYFFSFRSTMWSEVFSSY